jgi:two-component sensor histidine kinase
MIKLLAKIIIVNLLVCSCYCRLAAQTTEQTVNNILKKSDHLPDDTAKVNAFLLAGSFYVNKPGTEPADMTAALSYANRALDLSRKLNDPEGTGKSYTVLSQIYREKGEVAQGNTFIKNGLVIFRQHSYPAAAAEAYFEASNYYSIDDATIRNKIDYYQRGLQYLEAAKPSSLKLAGSLKFMGDLYQCNAEYPRAVVFLRRALAIYQQAKYKQLQDIYSLLGSVEMEMLDMASSVRDNLQAVKLAEAAGDKTMTTGQVYYNLALVYGTLYDYKSSLIYFKKANAVAEKNNNGRAVFTINLQIAEAYRKLHNAEQSLKIIAKARLLPGIQANNIDLLMVTLGAYNELHQYKNGRPYFELLDKQMPGLDMKLGSVQRAFITLLDYLLGIRQYDNVEKRLGDFVKSHTAEISLFQVHLEITAFKADSASGKFLSAIKHQNKATELKMLITKKNYDNQIANQRVLSDNEKKDQELYFRQANIAHLTHENQLQKATLNSQRLIRNLFIAGIALLALLLGLGYSRYKIKYNANKQLELQQQSINEQNVSLKQLLTERDWLLKEVHHRVKNNLQIIMSLMRTQIAHLKTDDAKDAFIESENRVQAIALIHQKLYNTDNLASINMPGYIADLVNYLSDGLIAKEKKVKFHQSVEPIQVDLAQAVPLGLILNEAITNAIKYGMQDNMVDITISVICLENNETVITIADQGKGLPGNFDVLTTKSLGMQMMKGLTRQLKGDFDIQSNGGVTVSVKFNLLPVFSANRINRANRSGS